MAASLPDTQGEMGLQFSVYPLRQTHIRPAIQAAVRAAAEAGVEVRVGRLSTFAQGDEEAVFRAIRAVFAAARSVGPAAMVITLTSGVPSEATVGEVQAAADATSVGTAR
jgi:uncharacterized protein YqgV (UPF0045/DUF77 family)